MRRLLPLLAVLLLLVAGAVAWIATQSLPVVHKVARSGRYKVPQEEMWAVVADLDAAAAWRTDVEAMEKLPDVRGHAVWREARRSGETVTLETVEIIKNRRQVRCVIDQGGPFGGCWTVEVAPRDDGSVVTVTESLTIHSLPWRLTHSKAGRKEALDAYLLALGDKFGHTPRLADQPRDLNTPPKPKP